MMHSLLAVVVSHGGSTHLHHLLSALVAMNGCGVVLVENDTFVGPPVPAGVRVLEGQGNVGYGTAVNLAVRRALEDGPAPDWLLVINSDVTIPPDTADVLPKLLAWYPPSVDVVGFPFLASEGGPGRSRAVLPTPRTSAFVTLRGEAAAVARWPELRHPVGAFFAIRIPTFLRLGGFDPVYWMYYEETDLFARLHAAGGRIAWADEEWPIVHVGGETVGRSGLLHLELGRAGAVYARRHRATLGWTWPAVHAGQLAALTVRKLITGHVQDSQRAVRILAGLAGGLVRPAWEPAVRSRWRAAPVTVRRRVGHLPPDASDRIPVDRIPVDRIPVDRIPVGRIPVDQTPARPTAGPEPAAPLTSAPSRTGLRLPGSRGEEPTRSPQA